MGDSRDTSVTRTVELEAGVDDVWRAVSTPELLSGWLDGEVEVDVRPGGDGTIIEPDGAVRRLHIDEVEPARRLALHWWPEDGSSPASTVELDLHPTPGGTRLVVTETLAPHLAWARAALQSGSHGARAALQSGSHGARASAAASARWDVRLLLLGCSLLQAPVACR